MRFAAALFAGANLQFIRGLEGKDLADFLVDFQQAVESVRRAPFPVVAALSGLCLGGGCEFALAADQRIVMAEVRMGLVEAGVGHCRRGAVSRIWRAPSAEKPVLHIGQ